MTEGVIVLEVYIESVEGKIQTHRLELNQERTIGREPGCDIVLQASEVSRRHLLIKPQGPNSYELVDNSANGTFMQGRRFAGVLVPYVKGEKLGVGPFLISFHSQTASPALQTATKKSDPARATPQPSKTSSTPAKPTPSIEPSAFAGKEAALANLEYARLRRALHRQLLDHLDLVKLDKNKMDIEVMRPKVLDALKIIIGANTHQLPKGSTPEQLIQEMCDEALGLGPLERLLADDDISEIMVVDPYTIFVERKGKIDLADVRFTDEEAVRAVLERIVTPLGRRIDESTPIVDARLKDGSRVNAVIRPLAIRGSCITIRKFAKKKLGMNDLVNFGTMTDRMAKFLDRIVLARKNVIISGGTGSGKTTLLNVLSGAIPGDERVVTIEDAAELRLQQQHVVSLETRPPNMEGRGEYSIRDLVKNALRMRPDRIIVGECRGGEALDMLQAMNTGHEGSMTTTHANSPDEAIARLETLVLMSGVDLPSRAIREQIASSVDVIIQQNRLSDGSRKISHISEVAGIEDGRIQMRDIFIYHRTGTDDKGKVQGEYRATGYLPSFMDEFIYKGLVKDGDYL